MSDRDKSMTNPLCVVIVGNLTPSQLLVAELVSAPMYHVHISILRAPYTPDCTSYPCMHYSVHRFSMAQCKLILRLYETPTPDA